MPAKQKFKERERVREFREEIKSRIRTSNVKLPMFASFTNVGRIRCRICDSELPEVNSFKGHLQEKVHKKALENLKDELEVQKKVNAHIEQLLKQGNEEEMWHEETIGMNQMGDSPDPSLSKLGKRTERPQLIIEERLAPEKVEDVPNDETKNELIEIEKELDYTKDDRIELKDKVDVIQSSKKDPLREKEKSIEERLKAKMDLMKKKIQQKK